MELMKARQVIGCAYTYQPSLAVRNHLTKNISAEHSSQSKTFSYFYKGDMNTIVGNNANLIMSKERGSHWPEAELALILGKEHSIIGVTLANDFTAISVETQGRTSYFDGTYYGKVWEGSCSLGPKIIPINRIKTENLTIGMRIERKGVVVYDHTYNTSRRKVSFSDLASMIIRRYKDFTEPIPPSKKIKLHQNLFIEGTVILTGTGLIVPKRYYSQEGDIITIYCPEIGELTNKVEVN